MLREIAAVYGCPAAAVSEHLVDALDGKKAVSVRVTVFTLRNHAEARRCYGWILPTVSGRDKVFTMLAIPPVSTPEDAVWALLNNRNQSGK